MVAGPEKSPRRELVGLREIGEIVATEATKSDTVPLKFLQTTARFLHDRPPRRKAG
jgi:hypothetical protein